jgi:hypothetical protein
VIYSPRARRTTLWPCWSPPTTPSPSPGPTSS